MYFYVVEPVSFISTVNHLEAKSVGQQFYYLHTGISTLRFCIKRDLLVHFGTTPMGETQCGFFTLRSIARWFGSAYC